MKTFDDIACMFPSSLAEALALQADDQARGVPLSGCTDLMVQWESGVLEMPERAIHIKDLPELQEVEDRGEVVSVGAAVTHMGMRRASLLQEHAPALVAAAATIGGFQMQSQGTIAGSIANASPAGDLAPTLLVYDASIVVASTRGEREMRLEDFMLGYRKIDLEPDELIIRFLLPKKPAGFREGFRKLGPREAQAISKVMGGYRGYAEGQKVVQFAVALGSVAPTAIRLREFESWVEGKELTPEVLKEAEQRASAEVQPIADIRSTAEYRKWVSGRLVRSFLEELIEG